MRALFIIIATLLVGIPANSQTVSTEELIPYDFDTTLKGGYSISFKVNDTLQYLFLQKGSKIISELASTSKGMLHKNLGYVGADFKSYFVLVHSFGSGNPHYIELIRKETGENILKEGAAMIDVIREKEVLLYSDTDVPSAKDKMTLYNVRTAKKQYFNFPSDIFGEPEILNRIQIRSLSIKQLVIEYSTEEGVKTKVYSR